MTTFSSTAIVVENSDSSTMTDLSPATDILAAPRHLKIIIEWITLNQGLQHLIDITGDKRKQFKSCSQEHAGRSLSNCAADNDFDFLGTQHSQQLKGSVKVKGQIGSTHQNIVFDFCYQQGPSRVEDRRYPMFPDSYRYFSLSFFLFHKE